MPADSAASPSRRNRLIITVFVVIVIVAVVVLALYFLAPGLLSNFGGTTSTSAPEIGVPSTAQITPASPYSNVEEKTNPFKITNPFEYKNPFG